MRISSSLILGIILLTKASTALADSVSLVADQWCPYNCVPNSQEPGFLIEIAQYGLAKGGHTVSYTIMPWTRAIEESRQGKYAGIVGALPKEVPDFIYPQIPLAKASNDFFIKSGSSWHYSGIESLSKISLGVIKDYSYSDELDDYIERFAKTPSRIQIASGEDGLDQNIKKMLAGRIDVLIEDHSVMEYYIKTHSLNGQISLAGSIGDEDIFVAFSPALPKSKEYANLVARGVTELRDSGKMQEILKKYGMK